MMCEHELKQALLDIEFLQECNNSANLALSVTRRELAAANARIAELTAERQRDALDGQAALDEANSRITSYEQQFGEYCKGAKSDVDYWKQRAEQAEAKVKRLIKKLTYNTPTFRDGECDEKLLTIDENELVPLKSCMCDRLKQAEAQCAAMRNCHNCKHYDMRWDSDGDWVQRCKYNTMEIDECRELTKWESEGLNAAVLAENKRMREALEEIASFDGWKSDIAKAALEEKP